MPTGPLVGTRRGRRARLPQAVSGNDARLLARSRKRTWIRTGDGCRASGCTATGRSSTRTASGSCTVARTTRSTSRASGIGPAELESAVVAHPSVAEAAAVGVPHEVKGEVAWIFCAWCPGPSRPRSWSASCEAGGGGAGEGVRARARALRLRAAEDAECEDRAARRAREARSAAIRATSRRWRTPRPWRRSNVSQPADRLDGRIALVTGGGRGIGAGIARELASAGARVAVAARTREQVEEVARRDRRARARGRRHRPWGRRADGREDEERAWPDRPARRQRGDRQCLRRPLGERPRRVVARRSRSTCSASTSAAGR